MPLAILPEPVEHEVVALLRQELRPVSNNRHAVRRVAQAELATFLHKPKNIFDKIYMPALESRCIPVVLSLGTMCILSLSFNGFTSIHLALNKSYYKVISPSYSFS